MRAPRPNERLRQAMEAAGHSVESLADKVDYHPKQVGRWISDGMVPRRAGAKARVAKVLDVDEDEIWPTAATSDSDTLTAIVAQLEDLSITTVGENQRRPVLRLLGHAHEALGEVAFDGLRFGEAADHFHQAHEIGIELGDPDLTANAVIQLGDIARRRRRYYAALRLLDATGQDLTAASLLTQVRQSQTLARTYAETGDRPAFEEAIGRAEQLAHWTPADQHRGGDHSPQGVRFERAQGLTVLGDARAALAIYEASMPAAFRTDRERANFLIIYAQALAHAGHLDEGVRLAIEGLELARGYGSARHVSRVQRMYDRLITERSPSEPHLVELHEALAG